MSSTGYSLEKTKTGSFCKRKTHEIEVILRRKPQFCQKCYLNCLFVITIALLYAALFSLKRASP
ncbi:MAG TPA: hypothetical protein DD803_12865 [Alcaligenes faecalis]|nr:hypothetical protein [Alcaligenes faecalis]